MDTEKITLVGQHLAVLRRISGWIDSMADSHANEKGQLVIHKKDFPGSPSKWQFLVDLARARKMGYVEDDKVVVDASKGYTPSNLKRATDYFLIGKKGEELKTLYEKGYLGKPRKQKTLSHGTRKPRKVVKEKDFNDWADEMGGRRTRKNGKNLRTTRRR